MEFIPTEYVRLSEYRVRNTQHANATRNLQNKKNKKSKKTASTRSNKRTPRIDTEEVVAR